MEINGNVNQKAIQDRLSEYIEYDALMAPAAFASKAGLDPSGFSKMLKGQLTITKKTASTYPRQPRRASIRKLNFSS